MPALLSLVLAVMMVCDAQAQTPSFEVVSVKPTGRPLERGSAGWTVSHGNFTAPAAWVRGMIAFAHGVHAAQVHGGPDWVDTEQYDVLAKAGSPDVSMEQMKAMVRTLLADRFKLIVHRETQELPIYALVVGKNGPKMQQARDNEKTYVSTAARGHLIGRRINMLSLIIILSNTLGTPVNDETGLTGFYDFSLQWADPLTQPVDSLPDIFRAVQEQLGLKMERKKGPVDIVIIDHIEKASEN